MAGPWDEEYINYLAAEPVYPSMPSYDEEELDFQGDYLTEAKKGAGLGADISYALMNGLLDPRVFQPLTSYEPVDARGYRTLQKWKQGTPYQQFVADKLEQGWGSGQIRNELQQMAIDPMSWAGQDPELAQAIIAELPRAYTQNFNDPSSPLTPTNQPDFARVDEDVQNLEGMIMSDPEYTIGPDGAPVRVKTEDSPMTEKARALGYYNTPGQAYDPWEFAPQGVTPEGDRAAVARAVGSSIDLGFADANKQVTRQASGRAGTELSRWLKTVGEEQAIQQGRPEIDMTPVTDFPVPNINPYGGSFAGGSFRPTSGSSGTFTPRGNNFVPPVGQVSGPMAPDHSALLEEAKLKNRVAKAMDAKMREAAWGQRQQAIAASDASRNAIQGQRMRQALVEHLARNNRTPFTDEVNRRNAGVYGGF
jgi:hypothetical protein